MQSSAGQKKQEEKVQENTDKSKCKQIKNIFTMVEEDEEIYEVKKKQDHWNDPEFVQEMDRRMEEFDSGKDKGIPWEDVQKEVRNMLDSMKKR